MSAFFGIISKPYALIATDTLCSYKQQEGDQELLARSYTCKTFLLPQYKSAFAVTGTLQAGLCFFNQTIEFTYGIDIDSLINIPLSHFRSALESHSEQFPTGTIYLLGYSTKDDTFKGFKLVVQPDIELNWFELPAENFIIKPGVERWEEKLPKSETQPSIQEFITNLMKLQKEEDKSKPVTDQVGIGGEIVCTQLEIDSDSGAVTIITKIIHQFEDYLLLGNRMANAG